MRKCLQVDGVTGEAQTSEMKRMTCILLLALAGLAILPQTALAGQFKKPVYYHVGKPFNADPVAVIAADFNKDANLDLAVANFGSNQVRVLLGKGDGTFPTSRSFSVTRPAALAVADFNGDHTPDLAVVEYGGTGVSTLAIFLGNGDGTFKESATYQLGVESLALAVADFDGDGNLDIAVTNGLGFGKEGSVMVFFGRGDGTFGRPTVYKLPGYPSGIAAADLNQDNHPDLAVTEGVGGNLLILLNTGGGKFRNAGTYGVISPSGVTVAKLRTGGLADIVIPSFQAVAVLLGKGDGRFEQAVYHSTRSMGQASPYATVVADFNLDGFPDIATVLYSSGDSAVLYGKGAGKFGLPVPIKLRNGGGTGIIAGDFDNDQPPDLAIVLDAAAEVAVVLNAR
jgi:hypothetical protein